MTPYFFIISTVLACSMAAVAFLPFARNKSGCRKKIFIGAALSLIPIIEKMTFSINLKLEKPIVQYLSHNLDSELWTIFSEPSRTQIPSYSDLVKSGDYSLENIDLKRRDKLYRESEFSIAILDGDVNEIPIVVRSKEGKCPFVKGECPWSKGEVYVLKMGSGDNGVWLSSYYIFAR